METKVEFQSMGMFFNTLGLTTSAHVDLIGKSGGIWMLWNPNNVNVRISKANSQMILATISRQNYPEWMLSAVYASPNPRVRDELWENLDNKFKRDIKELIKIHKPDILVLMETKVEFQSMGMFFNTLGLTTSAHVDLIGKSGGIWMLWNPNNVNVRISKANSQMILATISRQNYPEWMLSAVYASPNPRVRDELWENLDNIAQDMNQPWLVAGDFNDYGSSVEKQGFTMNQNQNLTQSQTRSRKFNDRINHCNLMDLGCTGPKLTWSNNRQGWANTLARLDRALCNTEWRTQFLDGFVRNVPRTYSDHSPMMVYTQDIYFMEWRST
ncbi:uncharacterized protein LOC114279250 [Camellia sinensis]|uniref:uncharacterized protein LOC114279250 n=1 Tax=Camellia sinensis TaxID=4442 RepID=UPI0010368719|nr:uncharacterized protein LOC114279250 [Camellia sinensis]